MYWGITPALDLLKEYLKICRPQKEVNILILGGADARHVLQTLCQLYRYKHIQVNFYLIDMCLELTARQLLLLNIALEEPQRHGLLFKVKVFMELYGNTLIRPTVAKYLATKAKQLVEMITNLDYCADVMKIINLNSLRYKERDYLENMFKYWHSADVCEITALWDRRVRQALGMRYDSKDGSFDWDLYMRLHPAGATQICSQEYKHWRRSGVAFTWLESEVSKPNRTLVAGVVPSGDRYLHHGYVGDLMTGPFVAFGLECAAKSMLRKTNNMNVHRATDVTEYNLVQLLYELHQQRPCPHKVGDQKGLGAVVTELQDWVTNLHSSGDELRYVENAKDRCMDVENGRIHFLSSTMLQHMGQNEKFKNFYNIIYLSGMLVEKLSPDVVNYISNSNCLLITENPKYIPTNKKEQLEELSNNIKSKLTSVRDAIALAFDPTKDCYAKYLLKSNEMVQSM